MTAPTGLWRVARDDLLPVLAHLQAIAPKKPVLPILACAIAESSGENLRLLAGDLEIQLEFMLKSSFENPGKVAFLVHKTYEIARRLPQGCEMQFSFWGEKMEIQANIANPQKEIHRPSTVKFTLPALEAADYPKIETPPEKERVRLWSKDLREALSMVSFCMASHDARPTLCATLFDFEGQNLTLVATDGHRLALDKITLPEPASLKTQVLLPKKAVEELQKMLMTKERQAAGTAGGATSRNEPVVVDISSKLMTFSLGASALLAKSMEGQYPDYKRVLPAADPNLDVEKEPFLQAVSRMGVVASEKTSGVLIRLSNQGLELFAGGQGLESAHETIPVAYAGQDMDIGFNLSYLAEALSRINGERVSLLLQGPEAAAMITAPAHPDFCYVLMPMRV